MSETLTLQDVTTVQDDPSPFTGNNLTQDVRSFSEGTFSITIQVLVSSLTLLGNLLLIRVLYDLPDSKLRNTTKLLLSYVSVSFCIFSIAILGRVFKMHCVVYLALIITSGFNILSGMLYLALETFFIVNRPHTHQKFVSMKICKIEILMSCLLSLCISLIAHATKNKLGDTYPCFITNGKLHPIFVLFTSGLILKSIIVTSIVQFRTLKAIRSVCPINNTTNSQRNTVSFINSNMEGVTGVVISPVTSSGSYRKSPLHKLTTILSVSLLCFIICWTPLIIYFFVFSLYKLLHIEVDFEHQVSIACTSLAALNGSLHIIVYLVMSTQIRQMVKKYCTKCICSHNF